MSPLEVMHASPHEEPILANLLELYVHDFSEFLHLELGPDGRFGYKDLPNYWREPNHHPLLVRMDSQWMGFALVKGGLGSSGSATVWDMAEFFVVRGHRRRGIGTQIAQEVWRQFPGLWQVRVMQSNPLALKFWERTIATFADTTMHSVHAEEGGELWHVFSFVSAPVTG